MQVAQYAISPGASANVSVSLASTLPMGSPPGRSQLARSAVRVSLYVAGMKQSTIYHMRGVVQFADGTQFNDADQTFTTGALPANVLSIHHHHDNGGYDATERCGIV